MNDLRTSPKHLQNVVESSLSLLREDENSSRILAARTPIGRGRPSSVTVHRQAISDGAQALGMLWRVSEVRRMMPKRRLRSE